MIFFAICFSLCNVYPNAFSVASSEYSWTKHCQSVKIQALRLNCNISETLLRSIDVSPVLLTLRCIMDLDYPALSRITVWIRCVSMCYHV